MGVSYAEGPHNYFIPFLPPAGGRWRVAPAGGDHPTVGRPTGCRRSAAASLMDHRIESWLDWHRHLPNIPYRYVAGLACMLDSAEWSYTVSIALRASLSCQRSVTTKYTDHTTSMTTIQSKTSIDVMLRLSASNTSSATICVPDQKV